MMAEKQPVTVQPTASEGHVVYQSSDGVTVRTMTSSDCRFASALAVNSFEGKFVHNIGVNKLEVAREAGSEDYSLSPHMYHRIFIAELHGERAGLMQLQLNEDGKMTRSDSWQRLGCWSLNRLCCTVSLLREDVPHGLCYLDHICVEERFRDKGVGKAMLAVADQQARSNGCHTIYLWVACGNRARNLYIREGYQKTQSTTYYCLSYCTTGVRKYDKMEKTLQ